MSLGRTPASVSSSALIRIMKRIDVSVMSPSDRTACQRVSTITTNENTPISTTLSSILQSSFKRLNTLGFYLSHYTAGAVEYHWPDILIVSWL